MAKSKNTGNKRSKARPAKKADDLQFHEWISRRRGLSLELLLALRRLFHAAEHWAKHGDPALAHGWNRLVGAGFALWRALPLLSKSDEAPSETKVINIDDARKLLDELVLHNRVTYGEDQRSSKWMAGFYLNCAEDRIHSTMTDELKSHVAGRSMPSAVKVASYAADRPVRLGMSSRHRWTHAWNGLRELTILVAELAVAGRDERAKLAAQLTVDEFGQLAPLALD